MLETEKPQLKQTTTFIGFTINELSFKLEREREKIIIFL